MAEGTVAGMAEGTVADVEADIRAVDVGAVSRGVATSGADVRWEAILVARRGDSRAVEVSQAGEARASAAATPDVVVPA